MRFPLLVLTIFTLVQCILVHVVALHSPGETIPIRLEMETGGSNNITCHMNLLMFPRHNSSTLYFVDEVTGLVVPQTDIVVLNETTIVFMLRNATTQNKNYVCKSGQNGIGVTHVSVGTTPRDVNNFNCRGYDYTYMVCNFTVPKNMILTQYNLSYTAQSPNVKYIECLYNEHLVVRKVFVSFKRLYITNDNNYLQLCQLEIQSTHSVCNLTLDKSNYRPNYEYFNFTLVGHNALGTNIQHFWINHYESIIPPCPEFHFEDITINSVVLSWHMMKYSYYNSKGLQYEILLRPKDMDWLNHFDYEIRNNKSEYKLKLRNLPYAYFWYTVSVRIKVKAARNQDMWSEPYVHTFQTQPCPPIEPPAVDVGSFYIDPTETRVRLYWQQLPIYLHNGPNFRYVVMQVRRSGVIVDLAPIQTDASSATFLWDKYHRYEFSIISRNDIGETERKSVIVVPPISHSADLKSPKWIRNIYHAYDRTYSLSWIPPPDTERLVDYTVFWCQSKRAIPTECKSSIKFMHVSSNITKFITNSQEQEHALNLAVSANYKDFTSGMHWTMCTADISSDLVKLEPEIAATAARSVKVQWSLDRICTSLLEGYNLIYCRAEHVMINSTNMDMKCVDKNLTVTIEKTAKKYTLTNLKPYSYYLVTMYMFSRLKVGKVSDVLLVQTKEEAPTPPRNLKYQNITSNSAWISWIPPIELNGKLRYYTVVRNNENYYVNCIDGSDICSKYPSSELNYKLENLSSFTNYKVYVIAHTVEASFPSNDIHFKTLIGIPSNPRHMVPVESNHTIMQWLKPEVPSGRVEFYEVCVIVWYKDKIKRQRISRVVGSTSCTINIPMCIDPDYKHTLEVRAVNVAVKKGEIDYEVFTTSNSEEYGDELYIDGNDDLKCFGTLLSEAEQANTLLRYRNTNNFVQYKSVWEKGPIYGCTATTKVSRVTMLALLVVISSLGVMAAFYFARSKYNKMADIGCELPGELRSVSSNTKGLDEVRQKDSEEILRGNNESHGLLASICNDSVHLTDVNDVTDIRFDVTSYSIAMSSGYVGPDKLMHFYKQKDWASKEKPAADVSVLADNVYMIMDVCKSQDFQHTMSNELQVFADDSPGGHSNVAPEVMKFKMIPSDSGPITRNKVLNWKQSPSDAVAHYTQSIVRGTAIDSNGYVASNMLHKSPFSGGYTALEALIKSAAITPTPAHSTSTIVHKFGRGLSPISGYVTQKQLSAFGQQRMS